eukprot:766129-Hanusia_phi.AAC.1
MPQMFKFLIRNKLSIQNLLVTLESNSIALTDAQAPTLFLAPNVTTSFSPPTLFLAPNFLRRTLLPFFSSPFKFPSSRPKDRILTESKGRDKKTGQDRTGPDRTGQDRSGQVRSRQDRTRQDRTGRYRGKTRKEKTGTGQDRTGQDSEREMRPV